ncbi:MAG: hypothetical protein WBY88_13160 [Desulfosarcina sp.]
MPKKVAGDQDICASKGSCPFLGDCVFMDLWDRAQGVMDTVYDQTTIQALLDREKG